MKYDELMKNYETIKMMEQDLGRVLTKDEKDFICENGFKAFFEKISLSDEEYFALRRIQTLISAYFTCSAEKFQELVKLYEEAGLDRYLDKISSYLKPAEKTEIPDPVEVYKSLLKDGKEVRIDDEEMMNKVIDSLWASEDNIRIEVRNNVIRLR